jgi:hypothetical protein
MKFVYKYRVALGEVANIALPHGAKVLHCGKQGADFQIWVEVPAGPASTRGFKLFGTGHSIPEDAGYISTVLDGPFVWHCYELY